MSSKKCDQTLNTNENVYLGRQVSLVQYKLDYGILDNGIKLDYGIQMQATGIFTT